MRSAGRVAGTREISNAYRVLVKELMEEDYIEDIGVGGSKISEA
jgi:hypothetical protein